MATTLHVTTSPDAILSAIAAHRTAWDAFQVAPEGLPSEIACLNMQEALEALLGTPCGNRYGTLALLSHLRWWLLEEAEFASDYQPEYGLALARASDLALFLGTNAPSVAPPLPPARRELPPVRGPRLIDVVGEVAAGVVLIVGGGIVTALATLI